MEGTGMKAYSWFGIKITKIFNCKKCNRSIRISKLESQDWNLV